MSKKHLTIGGSSAERTIKCPGWLSLKDKAPPKRTNHAAEKGTLLHDIMDAHYSEGVAFADMIGCTYGNATLSYEDMQLLQIAKDNVEFIFDKYEVEVYFVEPFLQIYPDKAGGSIDLLGFSKDFETAIILDFKFGAGAVRVKQNSQLLFYALAAKTDPKTADYFKDVKKLALVIVQPKLNLFPSVWECDIIELQHFKTRLDYAIDNPDTFRVGSHCSFCPAISICPLKKIEYPAIMKKLTTNFFKGGEPK
jgi:hypothetical protein